MSGKYAFIGPRLTWQVARSEMGDDLEAASIRFSKIVSKS